MGGLGEAISVKLHDAGYRVVVTHSPGNAGAQDWLACMKAANREFHAYAIDVADYDSCERGAAKIKSEIGAVDILVNNAGITRDMTFRKLDKVNWDVVMRTNLDSVFNVSKQLCDGMVERAWGRIINISSVNGSKGSVGQTNYAAAKAGIHGFTKSLALEVAKKGVTVNTISPGYLATKMVTAIPQDVLDSKILPQIPMGRLGDPYEVAALVLFLCSDDAAFVTGANIPVNGGQHMQ
jgi:acetoacetyl-CoA reductase